MRECTQNDDVTEVEAVDTPESMTCRKYGWSAGDSMHAFYANKHVVEQQQQQQQVQDVAEGDDATDDTEEQLRHKR